jgi:hypothetical protein
MITPKIKMIILLTGFLTVAYGLFAEERLFYLFPMPRD